MIALPPQMLQNLVGVDLIEAGWIRERPRQYVEVMQDVGLTDRIDIECREVDIT